MGEPPPPPKHVMKTDCRVAQFDGSSVSREAGSSSGSAAGGVDE